MNLKILGEYKDGHMIMNHCIKFNPAGCNWRPGYHDAYEILFIRDGNVTYGVGEESFSVRKNGLIFTRPQHVHELRVNDNTPYDRYDLLFAPEEMPADILAKIPASLHVINFEANRLVIQLFEKMDYYCKILSTAAFGKLLRSLTEELLINILIEVDSRGGSSGTAKNPLTVQATAFIEEHLLDIAGVEDICRHLSISKSYLYQLFSADLETTPKQYITQRRLLLARREIIMGAKATDIYSICGFLDYSSFFRAYKKQFGYPPSETRQSAERLSFEDILWGSGE